MRLGHKAGAVIFWTKEPFNATEAPIALGAHQILTDTQAAGCAAKATSGRLT